MWPCAAGVRALYNSFRFVGPPANTDFVILCTQELEEAHRQELRSWGIKVLEVEHVPNPAGGLVWTHPACTGWCGAPCCSLCRFPSHVFIPFSHDGADRLQANSSARYLASFGPGS